MTLTTSHAHYLAINEPIYRSIANHPNVEFDDYYFVHLLENSLSLTYTEKKEVIMAMPRLSQFQVDELVKVFLEEREQFKAVMDQEGDSIIKLYEEAKKSWEMLISYYEGEEQKIVQDSLDTTKLDEIRKALMS